MRDGQVLHKGLELSSVACAYNCLCERKQIPRLFIQMNMVIPFNKTQQGWNSAFVPVYLSPVLNSAGKVVNDNVQLSRKVHHAAAMLQYQYGLSALQPAACVQKRMVLVPSSMTLCVGMASTR